jgi:hypothetical protein
MKLLISPLLAIALLVPFGLGQGGEAVSKPARRKKPPIKLIPFYKMAKAAGFELLRADSAKFIEMSAFMFTASKENCPKLTAPTNVVQLTYGYKKSGIGCVYLAPMVPGLKAEDILRPLVDKHILRDRQYFKDWSIKTIPNPRLLVMVSGTTPEVRDELAKGLK